jgi:hypothetical protein
LPAVIGIGNTYDEIKLGHPIDEFHCSVVPNEKNSRQLAHRNRVVQRKSLDRQQCLMLLRCQLFPARGSLAESQELSQFIPKAGERSIVDVTHFVRCT